VHSLLDGFRRDVVDVRMPDEDVILGTAFHWSVSDSLSNILQTSILVALGLYWIALAIYSKWVAKQEPQPIW
jgi:hypothetical protein